MRGRKRHRKKLARKLGAIVIRRCLSQDELFRIRRAFEEVMLGAYRIDPYTQGMRRTMRRVTYPRGSAVNQEVDQIVAYRRRLADCETLLEQGRCPYCSTALSVCGRQEGEKVVCCRCNAVACHGDLVEIASRDVLRYAEIKGRLATIPVFGCATMSPRMIPLRAPNCAKCKKPVPQIECYDSPHGFYVLKLYCHDAVEEQRVPLDELRGLRSVSFAGEAFAGERLQIESDELLHRRSAKMECDEKTQVLQRAIDRDAAASAARLLDNEAKKMWNTESGEAERKDVKR